MSTPAVSPGYVLGCYGTVSLEPGYSQFSSSLLFSVRGEKSVCIGFTVVYHTYVVYWLCGHVGHCNTTVQCSGCSVRYWFGLQYCTMDPLYTPSVTWLPPGSPHSCDLSRPLNPPHFSPFSVLGHWYPSLSQHGIVKRWTLGERCALSGVYCFHSCHITGQFRHVPHHTDLGDQWQFMCPQTGTRPAWTLSLLWTIVH